MTPITIKNVPSDILTLTKLLKIVKRKYKTKGSPSLTDRELIMYTCCDICNHPHWVVDEDGDLLRTNRVRPVSIEARRLLFPNVRKELTA